MSRVFRAARAAALLGGTGYCGYCVADSSTQNKMRVGGEAVVRGVRDAVAVSRILAIYAWRLHGLEKGTPEYASAIEVAHQDGAHILLDLCVANKRLYIKYGQLLAQFVLLIPDAYTSTLRVLFDAAPSDTFDEVSRIVEEDLGHPIGDLFASFSQKPLASASLAQVHEATLPDGTRVAVKVQHADLRESISADIATVRFFVGLVHWLYPDVDFRWLVDEGEKSITKELNFSEESSNCKRAAALLKGRKHIKVPAIFDDLTTPRVLTMSFEEGVPLHNTLGLVKLGVDRAKLSSIIMDTFYYMIFAKGAVHGDPHPGNLLVRKSQEDNDLEVVLLDHGLYRFLDDEFRLKYCRLWLAIIEQDLEKVRMGCCDLGLEAHWHFFTSMVTLRPWNDSKSMRNTTATRQEMQQ
eukprot:Sspe_Gene.90059::Locus_61692_Transcript_2_2_Confidence_0.800_Length_1275::g.90059::m.90059/K08869/ADCK, ABC1; aarF domain-containing kinase